MSGDLPFPNPQNEEQAQMLRDLFQEMTTGLFGSVFGFTTNTTQTIRIAEPKLDEYHFDART